MMLSKKIHLLFLLVCSSASAQYISTDETRTPTQLIENVLINSGCASVTNVSVSGGNFATGEKSWGYFNANGSAFPFSEGVILSTGKIVNAQGPNTFISDDGGSMGWGGDADLDTALNISNSLNSTVLEFDFIPLGNKISFDYIFSSEEYHGTATCTYSDGFAFLLKEVGAPAYQNLALIPNTNIPVKVTSVHPDIPGGCTAQNEQYFGSFNDVAVPTNFNGETKVLTAQSAVIPGHQYHIKLVIADEGNYRYDSAIFLKGSSFEFGIDLGPDRTFANQNPVCSTETLTLNGTSAGAVSYQWYFGGTAMLGETTGTLTFNPPYTTAQNGAYSLVTTFSPTCSTKAEIELEFAPQLTVNQSTYEYCDADAVQDGITTVTLSDIVPTLFTNLPSTYQVRFYASAASTTPLPDSFRLTTPFQQIVYAKIADSNCYPAFPVTLNINVFTNPIADETVGICNNTPTNLTADSGYTSYTWNTGETSQSIQVAAAGTYTVTIENADGCTKIKTFTVTSSAAPVITNVVVDDLSGTNSATIYIELGLPGASFEYSIDGINYQPSPDFTNLSSLVYTAYARDVYGCGEDTMEFYLIRVPKYFTPNGDGFNDFWNIKSGDPGLSNAGARIYIFDRFGKLMKQISALGPGWDGTFNNKQMPGDDYWYTIQLNDGRSAKGHFTLKR